MRMAKRLHRTDMQIAILSAVKVAGLLAWILVAPNTLQLLKTRKNSSARTAMNATRRLIDKGYLRRTKQGLELTEAGAQYLDSASPPTHIWDRKWRIVIFDIPERRKKSRDTLRGKLQQVGFQKLQSSVWIYPYDCEELLILLKKDFKLGKEVSYITAQRVENDAALRARFGL
jgi:CRISPR-associated endonuclease Cas2